MSVYSKLEAYNSDRPMWYDLVGGLITALVIALIFMM